MPKVQPLGENVIVKPLREEETKSGIVIPATVDKQRPERGEVIAVGPGKFTETGGRLPMDVRVGQKVLFKKYSPDEIKMDGEELLVIAATDIIAVLE